MAVEDPVLSKQAKAIFGLAVTAAALMGGFMTFTLGISDRYVSKELFEARMSAVDAQIQATKEVLSAQIDALRAEIRASGKDR